MFRCIVATNVHSQVTEWPGLERWSGFSATQSFQVPFSNTFTVLPLSAWHPSRNPVFGPVGLWDFDRHGTFTDPAWTLIVTNRLTCMISVADQIIDVVHFPALTNVFEFPGLMFESVGPMEEMLVGQCFRTNRIAPEAPPEGIEAQMNFSLAPVLPQSVWNTHGLNTLGATGDDIRKAVESFQAFVYPNLPHLNVINSNLIQIAPFSPVRKLVLRTSWQADDPLVHHLPEHLSDATNSDSVGFLRPTNTIPTRSINLGRVNVRSRPWDGGLALPGNPDDQDPAQRDPGVRLAEDWNFPTESSLDLHWLTRVHRGTPWQSVYLGGAVADPLRWIQRFGSLESHPTNDWRLAHLFLAETILPGTDIPTSPLLMNNLVLGNQTASQGGAVVTLRDASPVIVNNIVSGNSAGFQVSGTTRPTAHHNSVTGNVSYNYYGVESGSGDLAGDPKVTNTLSGKLVLAPDSPCIDAGSDETLAWVERSGPTAISGARIDVGPLEYCPAGKPLLSHIDAADAENGPMLTLWTLSGQTYVIEASEDLLHWTPVQTNVSPSTTALISLQDKPSGKTKQFYRAVLLQ